MDFLLPDDAVMQKMAAEYARLRATPENIAAALGLEQQNSAVTASFCDAPCPAQTLIALYFVFILGYNSGYGTAIHDTDRSVGRFQSGQGTFGNINNLFYRDR